MNILSGMIRYGDFALPIAFEAIRKNLYFCTLSDRKEKRRSNISKNEFFRNMLQQAVDNQVKFDYILADNWFGAKKNMEFIHYDMEKTFIFGMKANRLIALSERERKEGQYQSLNSLNLRDEETKIVWLKDLSFPVRVLRRIFKNENGTTGTLYLVTNDLNLDAEQIYDIYQKRWRIEEYHKSVKQKCKSCKISYKGASLSEKSHFCINYCILQVGIAESKNNTQSFCFEIQIDH